MLGNDLLRSNKLPKGYQLQPGCHCCAHVVRRSNPDMGTLLYCGLQAPKPPPSPEPAEGSPLTFDILEAHWLAFDDWSDGRDTVSHGTCSEFSKD
jgi:hypothetical protein